MAKVKKKSTKKKNDESSIYSGVAINIADDCKTSKKMVKDWTKIMNNNANSSPFLFPDNFTVIFIPLRKQTDFIYNPQIV